MLVYEKDVSTRNHSFKKKANGMSVISNHFYFKLYSLFWLSLVIETAMRHHSFNNNYDNKNKNNNDNLYLRKCIHVYQSQTYDYICNADLKIALKLLKDVRVCLYN